MEADLMFHRARALCHQSAFAALGCFSFRQSKIEIVPGFRVVRLDLDRLAKLTNRLLEVPQRSQERTEGVVAVGRVWFQADGLTEFDQRGVRLAAFDQHLAETVVRLGET